MPPPVITLYHNIRLLPPHLSPCTRTQLGAKNVNFRISQIIYIFDFPKRTKMWKQTRLFAKAQIFRKNLQTNFRCNLLLIFSIPIFSLFVKSSFFHGEFLTKVLQFLTFSSCGPLSILILLSFTPALNSTLCYGSSLGKNWNLNEPCIITVIHMTHI